MDLSGILHAAASSFTDAIASAKPSLPHTPELPSPLAAPAITDSPCIVSFAATPAPTNAQTFLALPESGAQEVAAFFDRHQDQPATTMVRSGTAYVFNVGGESIKMDYRVLAGALTQGQLSPRSALGVSVLAFDVASRSQLPQGAIRSVLGQMMQSMAGGQTPQAALRQGYHNIVLATQVETYVRHKDGLATDTRRIGQYTADAEEGRLGAKGSTIAEHQTKLDSALHRFCEDYGGARESGDYATSFDSLQNVFRTGSECTALPHWLDRGAKLAGSLALPDRTDDPGGEILDFLQEAIKAATDAKASGKDLTPAEGTGDATAPAVTALADVQEAMQKRRKQLARQQAEIEDDGPAARKAGARAVQAAAVSLAERSNDDLQQTFQAVADGFSTWESTQSARQDFQSAYTQSTIEYLLLLDRFADGLEALKQAGKPRHKTATLPPDAVNQPRVLASFIEAIANRLAEAAAPGPHLPDGAPGRDDDLIAASLRMMIAELRSSS